MRNLIVRSLAKEDDATINNVMPHLEYAAAVLAMNEPVMYAEMHLDRAAQRLWGTVPPQGVKVDDKWHYYFAE